MHRREEFRASPIMVDRAHADEKIELVLNKIVDEVLGDTKVTGMRLRDTVTGELSEIETDGFFVAIGHDPNTALFLDQLDHEPDSGYLVTKGKTTETNIPGVFAAGDVQDHTYRQAVTAAGSGCAAALDAERFLSEQRHAALTAADAADGPRARLSRAPAVPSGGGPEGIAAPSGRHVDGRTPRSPGGWPRSPSAWARSPSAAVALWPFRSLSTDEAVAVARARQPLGDLLPRSCTTSRPRPATCCSLKAGIARRNGRADAARRLRGRGRARRGAARSCSGRSCSAASAGSSPASRSARTPASSRPRARRRPTRSACSGSSSPRCCSSCALERGGGVALGPLRGRGVAPAADAPARGERPARPRRGARRAARAARRPARGVVVAAAGMALAAAARRVDGGRPARRARRRRRPRPRRTRPTACRARPAGAPLLAVAAIAGLVALVAGGPAQPPALERRSSPASWPRRSSSTILAAVVLPVFPDRALVPAPRARARSAAPPAGSSPTDGALDRGRAALVAVLGDRRRVHRGRLGAAGGLAGPRSRRPAGARRPETVVVLPERSRAAFAYYAPYARTSSYARGDGAWVAVVADDPPSAIAAASRAVRTPRYALLRQFRYGDGLRLQHWVRP